MNRSDLREAEGLIALICTRLAAMPPQATSAAAAELRRLTGALTADAGATLRTGTLSTRLLACFEAARGAGAGFGGFVVLRTWIAGTAATGRLAQIVRQDAARRCLVQMARSLAAQEFKTREVAVAAQAQANAAFGEAAEETLSAFDTDTHRTIVALHAAVTRDLTSRARPLPRVVTITTGSPVPALVLAQRLYGDAGRADELAAANGAKAPLFMPQSIQALSA